MPKGVTGDVDDAGKLGPDREAVGLGQRQVQAGKAVGIGSGAEDLRSGPGAQGVDALDVVVVVVGDEDVGQAPLVGGESGQNRARLGHVDDRGLAGVGVVDQIGVVVGKAGDGDEVEHGL